MSKRTKVSAIQGAEIGEVTVIAEEDYGAASGPLKIVCDLTLPQAIRLQGDLTRLINDAAARLP